MVENIKPIINDVSQDVERHTNSSDVIGVPGVDIQHQVKDTVIGVEGIDLQTDTSNIDVDSGNAISEPDFGGEMHGLDITDGIDNSSVDMQVSNVSYEPSRHVERSKREAKKDQENQRRKARLKKQKAERKLGYAVYNHDSMTATIVIHEAGMGVVVKQLVQKVVTKWPEVKKSNYREFCLSGYLYRGEVYRHGKRTGCDEFSVSDNSFRR